MVRKRPEHSSFSPKHLVLNWKQDRIEEKTEVLLKWFLLYEGSIYNWKTEYVEEEMSLKSAE